MSKGQQLGTQQQPKLGLWVILDLLLPAHILCCPSLVLQLELQVPKLHGSIAGPVPREANMRR